VAIAAQYDSFVLYGVIIFNLIVILLAVGVARKMLPIKLLTSLLAGLHNTLGITVPTENQARMALLIWLAAAIIIVDGIGFLLVYVLTRQPLVR
jgi:hypothetical protein